MIQNSNVNNTCELIQNDLDCILEGIDSEYMDRVCQMIVDRMHDLDEMLMLQPTIDKWRKYQDAHNKPTIS